MFKGLIDRYNHQNQHLCSEAVECKVSAQKFVAPMVNILVEELNQEVREIYRTQTEIEKYVAKIKLHIAAIGHRGERWAALVDQALGALKEIGDFENYLDVLQEQAEAVEEQVQQLKERSELRSSGAGDRHTA